MAKLSDEELADPLLPLLECSFELETVELIGYWDTPFWFV